MAFTLTDDSTATPTTWTAGVDPTPGAAGGAAEGIARPKSIVDFECLEGTIHQVLGVFDEDSVGSYGWDFLSASDYTSLETLAENDDGARDYILDPGDGHTYRVLIADLHGVLTLNSLWRRNVRIGFHVLSRLT